MDEAKLEPRSRRSPDAVRELFGNDTDGDLVVNAGVAYALDTLLRPYVQTGGIVPNRVAGTDTAIARSAREISDYEKRLTANEAELKRKYGLMEGALSEMEKNSQTLKNFTSGHDRQQLRIGRMRLTINGEAVPFSLENERTLGEVVEAVERWLAESGFAWSPSRPTARTSPLGPDAPWRARPVDGVVELDVRVAARGGAAPRALESRRPACSIPWPGPWRRGDGAGSRRGRRGARQPRRRPRRAASQPAGPDAAAVAARLERLVAGATAASVRAWPADRRAAAAAARARARRRPRRRRGTGRRPGSRPRGGRGARRTAASRASPRSPCSCRRAVTARPWPTVTDLCDAVQRLLPLVSFLPRDPDREHAHRRAERHAARACWRRSRRRTPC